MYLVHSKSSDAVLESDSRPIFCGLGLGLGLSGLGLGLGLEGPGLEFDSVTRFPSHHFAIKYDLYTCLVNVFKIGFIN